MTEHRLHPFAALRVLRKTLVLYLVPLLRVLFERNWAALRAALRQDLILFLLVCALSWVILHASSWMKAAPSASTGSSCSGSTGRCGALRWQP